MNGSTISHYRLGSKLGEGGMGVVYEATDTILDRTVALKILNCEGERSEENRQRLLREARTAASLNHGNICMVHEVIEDGNRAVLVMEFVEGETLRRKIEQRPLKLPDAIDIAIQIAKGLAAAHAKGVVHRDIKSNNVMITPDGQAKILDFGLARGRDSKTITEAGACIGTPAYMAPEQVRGETVDRRADIWALGILIYEMLSGKAPFESDSPAAGFYRILDEQPEPLTAVRQGVPVELDRIVFKAIAKDPAERYQHVDELAVDLQSLRQHLSSDGRRISHPIPADAKRSPLPRFAMAGAGVILLAAAGWFAWTNLQPEGKTMRFISRLPEGHAFSNVDFFSSAITITRDGSSIVYVAREGKKPNLWRRNIGEEEASVIAGTDGGLAPFLSQDKQWVGYVEGRSVKRVSTFGGAPETVSERPLFNVDIAFFGGAFSPDGQTIIASECTRGLRKFALAQKEKLKATDVFDGDKFRQHQFPQVLPGGRYVLYTQWSEESTSSLAILDLETGASSEIHQRATYGRYVPSGHIVYGWENDLYAVRFDLEQRRVTGTPVLVVKGVLSNLMRGAFHFDVSDNGTLVYIPGKAILTSRQMAWVDPDGKVSPATSQRWWPGALRLTRNGKRILSMGTSASTAAKSVGYYDFTSQRWQELATHKLGTWWPIWNHDESAVFYNERRDNEEFNTIHTKPLDPSFQSRQISRLGPGHQQPLTVSPDGKTLLLVQWGGKTSRSDIVAFPTDGGGQAKPFANGPDFEYHAEFSPDGKWVAHTSQPPKQPSTVVVRSFHDPSNFVQVADNGVADPLWSRDGKRLFYRSQDGRKIYAVDFNGNGKPETSTPRLLVEGDFQQINEQGRTWDVSPDGKRFLVWLRELPIQPPTEYHVILNWDRELKRLAPASD